MFTFVNRKTAKKMIDRIKKIMIAENLSAGKFAEEIGIKNARLSHYLSGRNNVSLEFVSGILERFRGINPEWLLFGRGDMYKSNEPGVKQPQPQYDLFSSAIENDPAGSSEPEGVNGEIPSQMVGEEQKPEEYQDYKSIDNEDDNAPVTESVVERPKAQKTMEKIIVMYADGTFDCYYPNGKRI